ncbi:MAG: PEP-CTERM sorting domain-containing protein [Kiritimatiellae bacterium]|nr:PEP-CTERM sorting domain-containing protein [Kiritimatiellia bacterium]
MSLVHSAINLDGEPIIVGTGNVPEPSSFLLLAEGGMLLSLRRRRFNAKRAKG